MLCSMLMSIYVKPVPVNCLSLKLVLLSKSTQSQLPCSPLQNLQMIISY